MAILPGQTILKLVKEGKLRIEPFYEDGIQPASYDARLGYKILAGPLLDEGGRSIDLRKEKNNEYKLETGQFASVMTEEKFELPNDISGRFGLRSSYTRKGLISFGGIQIDPGWRGHLVISLTNVGPEPIKLKMGEKIFTIEFHRLEEATEFPYRGEYQNQYDFPPEDHVYIVEAETQALAKIPLLESRVKELDRTITTIMKRAGLDPFNIPLEEFNQLTFDERRNLTERVYELCRREIKESFKEAEYVVICDHRVIMKINDPMKVSGQEITKLMRKYGKPCYTFSRPLIIEEASWSVVREKDGDYYPTVRMQIGAESWNTDELKEKGKNVVADFDTGNPYHYLIVDERLSEGIVPSPTPNEFIRGEHLGRPYYFFLRTLHVGIIDLKRKLRSRRLLAQLVRDWRNSPFVETSPYREGFTGRHIMFTFNFKITLDPKSRTSLIEYVN